MYTNYENPSDYWRQETCDRRLYERKKNGQIKGKISRRWPILYITIQLVITNVCIKFQNPRLCSSCESFDENFHWSERWKKEKIEKVGKMNLGTLVMFSVIHLVILVMYTKLEDSSALDA